MIVASLNSQDYPEEFRDTKVKTAQIITNNIETSIPIYRLNSRDFLSLEFDILSPFQDNLFYAIELRDYNWEPLNESYDYWLNGNFFNFISDFSFSSYSLTPYVHYRINFPNQNCQPLKSGNYLIKVFRETDTANLVFSKKFYVVSENVLVKTEFGVPYNGNLIVSDQKINMQILATNIENIIPENLKVDVWQNAVPINKALDIPYQFYVNNTFSYDADRYLVFPGNREFNYIDLRNFKFKSFNVKELTNYKGMPFVILQPDLIQLNYLTNPLDLNGFYYIQSTEYINPVLEAAYAYVKFTFAPKNAELLKKQQVFIDGVLSYNGSCQSPQMDYDSASNSFTKILLLKQGFYSYSYYIKNPDNNQTYFPVNFSDTENDYYIFVYYKYFDQRHYSLVGNSAINSVKNN
ncbi:MAG: DUF5103 domain-containing protein [Sediminibacterium sp.]|nr:DUF5103 domain-containing protein [Sediminibacterium sp.]